MGPMGIIYVNACVLITIDMEMRLRDFGPYVFYACFGLMTAFSVIEF
jgi:hypothetical protein